MVCMEEEAPLVSGSAFRPVHLPAQGVMLLKTVFLVWIYYFSYQFSEFLFSQMLL